MSDGPLSPEEVAHRGFGTAFRGFDTGEVRSYLLRVANELRASTARERDLHRRLADAEHRASHPVIDGDTLSRALGEEMGRILASAQEAARELKARAEENAARILREAHDQAQRIRAQSEAVLADRTEEAENEAAEIRRAAAAEATGVLERARREATSALADVDAKARQLVQEAQTARARVLGDLTRRRRSIHTQVEQLRAGRERLLDAYRVVRRTLDEVADELQRVEGEAREAAGAAAERLGAEPELGAEELDDVLAAFPEVPEIAEVPAPDTAAPAVPEPGAGPDPADGPAPVTLVRGTTREPLPPEGRPVEGEPEPSQPAAAEPGAARAEGAVTPDPVDVGTQTTSGASDEAQRPPRSEGGPDRRSSPLRLLRRPRDEPRPSLDVVEAPPEGEGVRVLVAGQAPPAEPAPPTPEATPGSSSGGRPADASTAGTGGGPAVREADADVDDASGPSSPEPDAGVDELFARIRAGRAEAVARAHEVLSDDAGTVASGHVGPAAEADSTAGDRRPIPGAEPVGGDERLLQRRDSVVEGIEARLTRKLKRALQDEQNEVLDRLRSASPQTLAPGVLPAADDHSARYRLAAAELLAAAAQAGVSFVSPGSASRPDVEDLCDGLAGSVAEPLRRGLERVLGGDSGSADQATLVERLNAVYREHKVQRLEGLAGDAVTAAFSRGVLDGVPPGASCQWVVDDDGRPCPDCDDNALAGPTPPGEDFPTGQRHPPAHAGCRCLLAPSQLPAAAGSG